MCSISTSNMSKILFVSDCMSHSKLIIYKPVTMWVHFNKLRSAARRAIVIADWLFTLGTVITKYAR